MAIFLAFPTTVHAEEMLEKEYIKAGIWEEIWLAKAMTELNFLSLHTSIIYLKNGLTKIMAMTITTERKSANLNIPTKTTIKI